MGIKTKIVYPVVYNTSSFLGRIIRTIYRKDEFYVLGYHRIFEKNITISYYDDVITMKEDFEQQCKNISENYNVVNYDDIKNLLDKKEKIPKNTLLMTFDDGYIDFKDVALSILNKYRLKSTLFIVPTYTNNSHVAWWEKISYMIKNTSKEQILFNEDLGVVDIKENINYKINVILEKLKSYSDDKKNDLIYKLEKECEIDFDERELSKKLFLNWNDIRSITKSGVTIGCHSLTHPILTKTTQKALNKEIVESKNIIESELSDEINLFSYPNGRKNDFNKQIVDMLRDQQYDAAFTMIYGSNHPYEDGYDNYLIKRILPLSSNYLNKQLLSTPMSKIINLGL